MHALSLRPLASFRSLLLACALAVTSVIAPAGVAMAQQPPGEQRNRAMATAQEALLETQQAMVQTAAANESAAGSGSGSSGSSVSGSSSGSSGSGGSQNRGSGTSSGGSSGSSR